MLAVLLAASSSVSCTQTDVPAETQSSSETETADTSVPVDTVDYSSMSFTEKMTYDRSALSDDLPDRDEGGADYRIGFLDAGATGMYTDDWIAEALNGDVLNDAVFNRNVSVEERFNVKLTMVSHSINNYGRIADH